MTFGSLFAGIGGFDSALESAGCRSAWQVEINSDANKVLEKHWPNTERFTDVCDFGISATSFRPDIIGAGWPCQGNSVAGKRAGMAHQGSGLWSEVVRILDEFRPTWFLGENVPGLLSVNGGRDFGAVLRDLAELGYGFAYRILDAQWFGVPQRRRRIFIVGCLGDWQSAAEILFESECLPWDSPPSRQAGQRIAASLTRGADSGGKGGYAGRRREDDVNIVGPLMANAATERKHGDGGISSLDQYFAGHIQPVQIAATLNSGGNNGGFRTEPGEHLVAHSLTNRHDSSEDGTGRGVPLIAFEQNQRNEVRDLNDLGTSVKSQPGMKNQCYIAIHPHCIGRDAEAGPQGKEYLQDGSAYTMDSRGQPQAVAFQTRIARNGRGQPKEITDALTSCEGGTHADSKPHIAGGSFGVRRLTPVECLRLQGFPDSWLDDCGLSDSSKYRLIGNSVARPCVEWIGRRIVESNGQG